MSGGITIKGILTDPEATARLAAEVQSAMASEGKRLAALVAAKAPADTGKVRAAVRHRVTVQKRKGKNPRVKLVLDADRATRPASAKEAPKRYGKVPYGVFSDHKTGWLTGTVNAEEPRVLERIRSAAGEYVRRENQRFPAPRPRR